MKIFTRATVILSAYKEPMLHQVKDIYSIIKSYLNNHRTSAHDAMAEKLEEYSDKITDLHWLTQILHPGIKLDKNSKKFKVKLTQLTKHAELTSKIMSDKAQVSLYILLATSKKNALESLQDLISDTIKVDLDISTVCKYDASAEINHWMTTKTYTF